MSTGSQFIQEEKSQTLRFFADTGSAVKSELYIRLERLTKVNLFLVLSSVHILAK